MLNFVIQDIEEDYETNSGEEYGFNYCLESGSEDDFCSDNFVSENDSNTDTSSEEDANASIEQSRRFVVNVYNDSENDSHKNTSSEEDFFTHLSR